MPKRQIRASRKENEPRSREAREAVFVPGDLTAAAWFNLFWREMGAESAGESRRFVFFVASWLIGFQLSAK
jgi:hypothetical protein